MGWFRKKKEPQSAPAAPQTVAKARSHDSEPWAEIREPEPAADDLSQRIYGLAKSTGLLYVVSGPGSLDDCLDAMANLVPSLNNTTVLPHGIGWFAGFEDAVALATVAGSSGSAALICCTPSCDITTVNQTIDKPLRRLPEPWAFDMGNLGRAPQSVASLISDSKGVPLWNIQLLQHLSPR